ncbi:MAG: hypothetical protein HFH94_18120 [Lachnospiraceae bacterium]|jgi:hypothetical protein|nr:hypothetical protein [uncultured Acetatifactor sp.]MCI9221589.1 hypothetical protein [Lachnospiraceae bacterium]
MIRTRHGFSYNLNSILSRLIYTRILSPASKPGSCKDSMRFIKQPDFELHQIYSALSVLAEESDYIQASLFRNTIAIQKRRTEVIYYNCTNFYFEIYEAEDDKQFGVSKENRPLPIVEMGLFMDRDGIPMAFCINPGNESESSPSYRRKRSSWKNFLKIRKERLPAHLHTVSNSGITQVVHFANYFFIFHDFFNHLSNCFFRADCAYLLEKGHCRPAVSF